MCCKGVIFIYCNSCLSQIPKGEITYCSECGVPLHKKCANLCRDCGKELCDSCYAENHFRCSECFDVNKPFKYIRRSYIKQYEMCPYSLYLQLVEGIDPPMSKYAELGIIVHSILEEVQKDKMNLGQALYELQDKIDEWNMSTQDDYSIIPLDLFEVGRKCIENFMKIKPLLTCDEAIIEEKIQFSLDSSLPDITCTLDRISVIGDKYFVHDWKTGKPMSGKKLIEDLQPPLYLYAVYKKYGKMPETFTLHYLQGLKNLVYQRIDDNTYKVKTSRSEYTLKIDEALEKTKKILKGINTQQFTIPEEKDVSWYCNSMCWYGISGYCKTAQTEEWHRLAKERKGGEA